MMRRADQHSHGPSCTEYETNNIVTERRVTMTSLETIVKKVFVLLFAFIFVGTISSIGFSQGSQMFPDGTYGSDFGRGSQMHPDGTYGPR
jgi:hypothetical protein